MTQEVLKKIRALDAAAAKAGGYVADPARVKVDPQAQRRFTELRQRSVRENTSMKKLLEKER